MAEKQTNPQFIFWVKEAGVFRPAEPKMPEDYLGYDLERNIQLGTQDLSPDTLNLVSSVYLGPINIFEEQLGHTTSRGAFERLREHTHGTVEGIVRIAEGIAKAQNALYFALNIVRTGKDRTWTFTEKEPLINKDFKETYYSLDEKLGKPKKPLEFVLHPTAQLYVPRR